MNNKLVLSFSMIVVIVFVVAAYFMFKDSEELVALETAIVKHPNDTKIFMCGSEVSGVHSFVADFSNRSQTKVSGSNPTGFFELKITVGEKRNAKFFIGQDSQEPSLFWVYPYEKPKVMIPMAYINSKVLFRFSERMCEPIKEKWVDIHIPR